MDRRIDYTPSELSQILSLVRETRQRHEDTEAMQQRQADLSIVWLSLYTRCAVLNGWLNEHIMGRCDLREVAVKYSEHKRAACRQLLREQPLILERVEQQWPDIPADASQETLAALCEAMYVLARSALEAVVPPWPANPLPGFRYAPKTGP